MRKLEIPISDEEIRSLSVGDSIGLNGIIVTGRDAAHKYMVEHIINAPCPEEELEFCTDLEQLLEGGVIYHCGPVVKKHEDGSYSFVAAGPTTSIREEVYQPAVIAHYNLKGVIGKGGMAQNTLKACANQPAVYFHAIGGAATLIAQSVKEVVKVHKLEFGVPEAMWVIRVEDFPVVVTMDSHRNSLHDQIMEKSKQKLSSLIN
jgi:fumarate hydratase subunit beta